MRLALSVLILAVFLISCAQQPQCEEPEVLLNGVCCIDSNSNNLCDNNEPKPKPVVEEVVEEKVIVESPDLDNLPPPPAPKPKEVPPSPPLSERVKAPGAQILDEILVKTSPPSKTYFYRVIQDNPDFVPYYIIEQPDNSFVVILIEKLLSTKDHKNIDTILVYRNNNTAVGTCVQLPERCLASESYQKLFSDLNAEDFLNLPVMSEIQQFKKVDIQSIKETGLYRNWQVYEVKLVNDVVITFDKKYHFPLQLVNPRGYSIIISDISYTAVQSHLLPKYDPLKHQFRKYVAI